MLAWGNSGNGQGAYYQYDSTSGTGNYNGTLIHSGSNADYYVKLPTLVRVGGSVGDREYLSDIIQISAAGTTVS